MRTLLLSSLAVLASALGTPALADGPLGPPLPPPELDAVRGGFVTPSGLVFEFGAVVRTSVDGRLALESTVSLSDTGKAAVTTASLGELTGGRLVIPGVNGETTLVHDVTGQALRNVVLNTADNRHISQETTVTLVLPNFDTIQRSIAVESMALRLADDMAAAAGLGR